MGTIQQPLLERRQAHLLFDGQCPFCLKSVATLKRLDWFGRLRCLDARVPAHVPPREPPLDPVRLMDEMHLLTPNGKHLYHGFAAFRWMAWRLPLLWPIAPLLYLPGVPTLGQKVYLWIARNRFSLVPCHNGMCTVPPRESRPPVS